ncbi:unnamed protein product, partial [Brachionus calyciflorus]
TSDICHDEQISVCFRFCSDDFPVKEKFIGFYKVQNKTGESLYELVCSIFSSNGLNLKNLVGQCYDGASNMSGEFKGLASRIKADSPGALIKQVKFKFKNLCPTRWSSRFNALKAVNDNFIVILETHQEITRSDRNTLANSIYLSIFTFDFLFYLDILTNFFRITNILSNKLQEIDLDYMNIKELAQTTIFALNDFKKEAIFDGFWSKTLKSCDELEISLPQSPRKRKKPKRFIDSGEQLDENKFTLWFKRFELQTPRWTDETRAMQVVTLFGDDALQNKTVQATLYEFYGAKQRPDETVEKFSNRLIKYTNEVNEQDKVIMEKRLINVFVRGQVPSLKKILTTNSSNDFDELVRVAKRIEQSEREEQKVTSLEANIENISAVKETDK